MRAFGKRPLILNIKNNDSFIGIVRDKIHSVLNGGVEEKKNYQQKNREEYEDLRRGFKHLRSTKENLFIFHSS